MEGFFELFAEGGAHAEAGYRKFLGDYSGVDPESILFSIEMIEQLVERFAPLVARFAPVAIATVCVSAAHYGVTRIFYALTDRPDVEIHYRAFLDRREAEEWLEAMDLPRITD